MMSAAGRICLIVLLYNCLFGSFVYGRTDSVLKRFETCDPHGNYAARVDLKFKTVGDKQYADGILNFTSPLDNTIRSNATVEMLILNRYQYMLSINERKACNAVHKYFGEFIYDLERYAQLIAGMCPIPEGVHRFHNFPLDFDKITTLASFPFGSLRFTLNFYDQNNGLYTCIIFEFEHRM